MEEPEAQEVEGEGGKRRDQYDPPGPAAFSYPFPAIKSCKPTQTDEIEQDWKGTACATCNQAVGVTLKLCQCQAILLFIELHYCCWGWSRCLSSNKDIHNDLCMLRRLTMPLLG